MDFLELHHPSFCAQYISDVKKKQAVAWAAVREAADVFLRPLYDSLQVGVIKPAGLA